MPIVSFWNNEKAETGQTLSMIAIATYMSIMHNYKILVVDTKFNSDTIKDCYWEGGRDGLINTINSNISIESSNIDFFSLDGIIKSIISFSLLDLVFSYSFRYIMIKVFVLLTPFAILSLSLNNTSWFFKSWLKNLFSLLFIQIIISIILLILFSVNYSSSNLISKFIYVGGLYALIKSNSFVREFLGSISTNISQNVNNLINFKK